MEYYQVLKNYLENAAYSIDDAKERIDFAVARGRITGDEAEELSGIATLHASEPPLAEQIRQLRARLATYESLSAWQDVSAEYAFDEGALTLSCGRIFRCILAHGKNAQLPPADDAEHWVAVE